MKRTEPDGASPRPGTGYRPHLDGLRTVAVYLVVLFHAGSERFAGGFLGVDVFFVLSGYLVTGLLVRELDRTGSVGFRRFYSRRARRLLPAAAVTLVGTAVLFAWIGSPADWPDVTAAARAAALYVSNWHFIAQASDYFAADVNENPIIHFWSLSVEEQFYFVWPLLLFGLHRLARRTRYPRRVLQGTVLLGALASLAWALSLAADEPNRAYFGTDTRAYQLLAGALLALCPGILARLTGDRLRLVVSAAGLVAMGSLLYLSSWLLDVEPIRRGAAATAATVVVLLALDAAPRGLLSRALALPPMVYLGRISYGTYLWHWPILILATQELDLAPMGAAAFAAVTATALASLSHQLVEMPIRDLRSLDLRPVGVVVTGLAMSLFVALVAVPAVFDHAERDGPSAAARSSGPNLTGGLTPDDVDWAAAKKSVADMPDCTAAAVDDCFVVHGDGPRLLILGDSHARMYIPMFEQIGVRRGLDVAAAVQPVCPWTMDLTYGGRVRDCRDAQDAWYGSIIDAVDPDIVVLSHRVVDDETDPVAITTADDQRYSVTDADYEGVLREHVESTIRWLLDDGRRVLVIEPVAQLPGDQDPNDCLAEADAIEECRFIYQTRPTPEEELLRRIDAAEPDVWAIDLDRLACPYFPICDPVIDGTIVRRDSTHLTIEFVEAISGDVEALLVEVGVLTE